MNNSKKAIKAPKKVSTLKKVEKNPTLWIIVSIVLVVVLLGGVAFDQLYKRVVLTINGDKYNMDDLSYYFYGVESKYDYINQLYGGTYYDTKDETSGVSYREMAKSEALSSAVYNEVMYKDAIANNYTLTDDEKQTVSKNVDTMLSDDANKAVIKKNHFTKKYLTDIFNKVTLGERYRKDIITSLKIDEAAIKDSIKYDDYKQYDIEYLYIPTEKTDDSGNSVAMTDAEKAAVLDKINSYVDKAKAATDWSTLIPTDEKDLKYVKNNFTTKSTTFQDDFKTKVMAMDNNAVSDVFESNGNYYLVRMINNNSTEAYDTAVKDAITNAEDEAFSPKYQDIVAKYTIKQNQKELDKYTMGEITIP